MAEKLARTADCIMSQGDTCPICGQSNLTSKWTGYVVVLNVEKSEIAKKLKLKINGSTRSTSTTPDSIYPEQITCRELKLVAKVVPPHTSRE